VQEGRTIAADFGVLPPLTRVYIEGIGERVVEDKGSAIRGQDIDLYIADLEEALAWGVQERAVYVIEWGNSGND
jgi:3D (Asp-Asp-Asp) domain-containing protein